MSDERRKHDLEELEKHNDWESLQNEIHRVESEIRECDRILAMEEPQKPKIRKSSSKGKWFKFGMILFGLSAVEAILFDRMFDLFVAAVMLFVLYGANKFIRDSEHIARADEQAKLEQYERDMRDYQRKKSTPTRKKSLEYQLQQLRKYERQSDIGAILPSDLNTPSGRALVEKYLRSGKCDSLEDACLTIRQQVQLLRLNDQLSDLNDLLRKLSNN